MSSTRTNIVKILGYILVAIYSLSIEAHDIHVSVNEIEINQDGIVLTLKTFLDDLQLAVGLESGAELPEGYTSSEEMIATYLSESISVKLNGNHKNLKIDEFSASPNSVWITLSYSSLSDLSIQTLEFKTTFLTEIYDDQRNMIKISTSQGIQSAILDDNKTVFVLEF